MLNLSPDEIESSINKIVCGGTFKQVENSVGDSVLLFFRYPYTDELVMADYIREKVFLDAKKNGLLSIEEMEALMLSRGIWSQEKEDEIKKLRGQIDGQKAVLAKTTKVRANRERLKSLIKSLEDKVWEIRKVREACLDNTIERKSEEERLKYLTWACSYKPDRNSRFWETEEDFSSSVDFVLRRNCTIAFAIFSVGMSNEVIRYIARSSNWRIRFISAQKNGGKLFSRDVSDYSVDMLNLMYWSNYYSSIYEMLSEDRPPEEIINDDEALDAYMEDYFKEQEKKDSESRLKKSNKYGKISAWNHDEMIVTKSNPIFEDVEYSETTAEKLRKRGMTNVPDISDKELKKGRFRT